MAQIVAGIFGVSRFSWFFFLMVLVVMVVLVEIVMVVALLVMLPALPFRETAKKHLYKFRTEIHTRLRLTHTHTLSHTLVYPCGTERIKV